jgi:hypothetical protein
MQADAATRVSRAGRAFRFPNGVRIGIIFHIAYEA